MGLIFLEFVRCISQLLTKILVFSLKCSDLIVALSFKLFEIVHILSFLVLKLLFHDIELGLDKEAVLFLLLFAPMQLLRLKLQILYLLRHMF